MNDKVEKFFSTWINATSNIEKYHKLIPMHKEIVDFLIDYDVCCTLLLSYKHNEIYELRLIGKRTWFNFISTESMWKSGIWKDLEESIFEDLHKVIVDPLELNLTDSRPWARLIGEYKTKLITKQDPQILEALKYLNRKHHGDPPPWKT
jgi:hypothetical protein